jgi:hypothetical protein
MSLFMLLFASFFRSPSSVIYVHRQKVWNVNVPMGKASHKKLFFRSILMTVMVMMVVSWWLAVVENEKPQ